MKTVLNKLCKTFVHKTIGPRRAARWITKATRAAGLDPLSIAYQDAGILNFEDLDVSGERLFLERYFKPHFAGQTPTIFDIGANIGEYAGMVVRTIPQARVFSFEPNPETYEQLRKNLSSTAVQCVPQGMASEESSRPLFVYPNVANSPHATLNRDVITGYLQCAEPREVACAFTSVDAFAQRENIGTIDLLKIDAEGNELDVIKGAAEMIAQHRVHCIQFEFGEADVYYRIFLRDFYEALPAHRFFRVSARGLIPLWEHSPANEIFQFQNIVAVDDRSPLGTGW